MIEVGIDYWLAGLAASVGIFFSGTAVVLVWRAVDGSPWAFARLGVALVLLGVGSAIASVTLLKPKLEHARPEDRQGMEVGERVAEPAQSSAVGQARDPNAPRFNAEWADRARLLAFGQPTPGLVEPEEAQVWALRPDPEGGPISFALEGGNAAMKVFDRDGAQVLSFDPSAVTAHPGDGPFFVTVEPAGNVPANYTLTARQ